MKPKAFHIKLPSFILLLCFAASLFAGCGTKSAGQSSSSANLPDIEIDPIIQYEYPSNPPEDLKKALENAAQQENLAFTLGDIVQVEKSSYSSKNIPIHFSGASNGNSGLISFLTYETATTNRNANTASFTVAFAEPEEMDDMLLIAVPLIKYFDSNLSDENAVRLAEYLLETLTVDGYGDPLDIGGYQIQLHNTNPLVFFRADDFTSNMALTVSALGEVWGTFNATEYIHMTKEVYDNQNEQDLAYVYFVGEVTEWYERYDYYGTLETFITVASEDGFVMELRMNNMYFPYNVANGLKYRFFVNLTHSRGPALYFAQQFSIL